MKSFYYWIFFSLCVLTTSGQRPSLYRTIFSGRPIQIAFSTPLHFQFGILSTWSKHLPVVYKSFDVKRLRSKVDLVWETAFECNNSGFEIQRKIGNGEWQKVAFVFSQASEGNSNGTLTYEYTDINTAITSSQYRLKQLDLDRSITYSEVRNLGGY